MGSQKIEPELRYDLPQQYQNTLSGAIGQLKGSLGQGPSVAQPYQGPFDATKPYTGPFSAITPYTGNLSAGLSSLEQTGLSQLPGLLQGSTAEQLGNKYLGQVLQGQYLSPDSNPYLSSMYQAAARQVQDQAAKQQENLDAAYNVRGLFYSGPRMQAKAEQAQQTNQMLADMAANMYGQAYQQERAAQQAALNSALGYAQMPVQRLESYMNMAGLPRQVEQSALDRLYQEFLRQQQGAQTELQGQYQEFLRQQQGAQNALNMQYEDFLRQQQQNQQNYQNWMNQFGVMGNLINLGRGQWMTPQYAPSPFMQVLGAAAPVVGTVLGGPFGAVAGSALGNWLAGRTRRTSPTTSTVPLYGPQQGWYQLGWGEYQL